MARTMITACIAAVTLACACASGPDERVASPLDVARFTDAAPEPLPIEPPMPPIEVDASSPDARRVVRASTLALH